MMFEDGLFRADLICHGAEMKPSKSGSIKRCFLEDLTIDMEFTTLALHNINRD